jgi:hypothetical protein
MTFEQILQHYGGLSKAAKALGLKRQTVNAWRHMSRVPTRWQLKVQAEAESRRLRADKDAMSEARQMAAYVNGRA